MLFNLATSQNHRNFLNKEEPNSFNLFGLIQNGFKFDINIEEIQL